MTPKIIKRLMQVKELSIKELARGSGISRSEISRYTRKEIDMREENLERLARALDVPKNLLSKRGRKYERLSYQLVQSGKKCSSFICYYELNNGNSTITNFRTMVRSENMKYTPVQKRLAKNLSLILFTQGRNANEIAKKSGISSDVIRRYMDGKVQSPSIYHVKKIAMVLGISVGELLKESDE